jgi:hypothetical protein
MPVSEVYQRQVSLLIRILPLVAAEECFALKGGTAINLFVRDMPRVSVDIDLTYLPLSSREESLAVAPECTPGTGDGNPTWGSSSGCRL